MIRVFPWLIMLAWLLKNVFAEVENEAENEYDRRPDYFTGYKIRPEDVWGHSLFDSVFDAQKKI